MDDASPALDIVEELSRRFQAGDIDGAFELYHPALRIEQPASLPHGGVFHGHAGVRAMGALFARFWERTITHPRRMPCGDGTDGVVQITTQTWTAKSTGRCASVDVVELLTLSGGQISEIRVFQQDTHRLLATLDEACVGRGQTNLWERSPNVHTVDSSLVESLCRHWEQGWNAADVQTIIAPFDHDIVFSSPFVARFGDDRSSASVRGLDAVRKYVTDSFTRATPGIRYTLDAAYSGTDAVVLAYTVHHPEKGDRSGADTMLLGADGKVVEWRCHYTFRL